MTQGLQPGLAPLTDIETPGKVPHKNRFIFPRTVKVSWISWILFIILLCVYFRVVVLIICFVTLILFVYF